MSERITAAEAADALGVHHNTIKHWIAHLPIPAEKDSAGRWRFGPEAVEVLKAIKELRDQDRSFDTIRVRIDKQAPGSSQEPAEVPTNNHQEPANQPPTVDGRDLAAIVGASLVPQVVEALQANNELAEKYARATYEIGKLTSDNEHLRQALASAQERIALLEAPKPEPEPPAPAPRRGWWPFGR
jgi:DNA-binding transcriptional MerR regulator